MRITPNTPEVRVPKLVGLMAVDAREAAEVHGVRLAAPDRPEFHRTVVEAAGALLPARPVTPRTSIGSATVAVDNGK